MEKYILAAAGLSRTDCPEYGDSLIRNWQLLDQLRSGSIETARSYLEWIRKISPSYYRDFVKQGLSGGRGWILKVLGNTEERQEWLQYCRNNKELQLRALTMMSYAELLQLDGERMDDEVQNLWLQTVAQRITENSRVVGSANEAMELATFVVNLSNVMKLVLMKDEDGTNERRPGPDADDLAVITAAIWQYEGQMDLSDRYTLCRIAKYTANADFEAMSYDFWTDMRPENFEELNQLSSVSKVFESSSHPNYYNYRLYAGYKRIAEYLMTAAGRRVTKNISAIIHGCCTEQFSRRHRLSGSTGSVMTGQTPGWCMMY